VLWQVQGDFMRGGGAVLPLPDRPHNIHRIGAEAQRKAKRKSAPDLCGRGFRGSGHLAAIIDEIAARRPLPQQ
jgi:hypothetical protein